MKVLVTGGAGYIGSHFVMESISMGHSPVVYDNLSTGHEWALGGAAFYKAELSDRQFLCDVLKKEAIEAVVHFAANAYVGESVVNPRKYFNNNYVNTLGLLDAMVETGVGTFVFSSSCAVYGTPDRMPITEDTIKAPINPYGLSKLFVEDTLKWYAQAYGLRYLALRYFNAAGAALDASLGEVHEPETHLIPLVLLAGEGLRPQIEVFGSDYPTEDGTCVRDYIHVLDLASAHLKALRHLGEGGPSGAYNLGTGRGHSVMEIINAASKVTGREIPIRLTPRREGDPPVLVADSSRAREALGWEPVYDDIETVIEHAWGWLKAALEKGCL